MNRQQYLSDARYAKVLEQMDLLQIMDVTTTRQHKNGTIVWKLPIKNEWNNGSLIEVASFKRGYVRNQNSGYSNYQLNKCETRTTYHKHYRYTEQGTQEFTGKYNKYTGKARILIPIEIDRLEYLISYCLKNYYIKHANLVPNGEYIPKWRYDSLADAARLDYENKNDEVADFRNEDAEKIKSLEENLDDAVGTIVKHETYYVKLEDKVRDLENKLATIKRIANVELDN